MKEDDRREKMASARIMLGDVLEKIGNVPKTEKNEKPFIFKSRVTNLIETIDKVFEKEE